MVLREVLVNLVNKEVQDHQGLLAPWEQRVHLDRKDNRDLLAQLDLPDHKDKPEFQDHQAAKDQLEVPVLLA